MNRISIKKMMRQSLFSYNELKFSGFRIYPDRHKLGYYSYSYLSCVAVFVEHITAEVLRSTLMRDTVNVLFLHSSVLTRFARKLH